MIKFNSIMFVVIVLSICGLILYYVSDRHIHDKNVKILNA
jgi:hypothetical protein